ncbi:hypothetical protein FB451DRAFT_1212469 [Mycena latifolia]|nr:hypothetical protein FB451DRAFT_1212469 [Mycena latifolia]
MSFAFTYGSLGDLLETAKLAVKVVKLLRDGASGKLSQERLGLVTELQTLNSDLVTLDLITPAVHLDPSSTHRLFLIVRIQSEVETCRRLLIQFIDKLKAPRGFLGTIIGAVSEESELARFRTSISKPLKAIRTLMAMLNLATSHRVGLQLGSQILQVEERMDCFGERLAAYHEAVLKLPIARGVYDDIFCVVDPVGGNIPISLRYCHVYTDLDRLIKAHLLHRPEAGASYIKRGDYNIVSGEGSIVSPVDFAGIVRAGMQVEMSIIKRQTQTRGDKTHDAQCPHCYRENAIKTENEWFKCANLACGRKYKINEQDRDAEEIISPQVAQERSGEEQQSEPELFRLVQIYAVYTDKLIAKPSNKQRPAPLPRLDTNSWATWQPDPNMVPTPPSHEYTLLVPSLFGPKSPQES